MIIIDNGHGIDTRGKRSPDGSVAEWLWTRRTAALLRAKLEAKGIPAKLLVAEDTDIPLGERCRRANALGADLLISIHVNAAGTGTSWHNARGFSAFVAPGASALSRRAAALLTAEARRAGLEGNRATPPDGFWQANFAILRCTRCPAVLTENLFMDNIVDAAFLASPQSNQIMADIHLNAILAL